MTDDDTLALRIVYDDGQTEEYDLDVTGADTVRLTPTRRGVAFEFVVPAGVAERPPVRYLTEAEAAARARAEAWRDSAISGDQP